jgi:transposase
MTHLANACGILQADGYKGCAALYELEASGLPRLREAAHWAHPRCEFHDLWTSTKSEIAREARDQIGKLYDIEHDINSQCADVRHAARQSIACRNLSLKLHQDISSDIIIGCTGRPER